MDPIYGPFMTCSFCLDLADGRHQQKIGEVEASGVECLFSGTLAMGCYREAGFPPMKVSAPIRRLSLSGFLSSIHTSFSQSSLTVSCGSHCRLTQKVKQIGPYA